MKGRLQHIFFWLANAVLLAGGIIPLIFTSFLAPRYSRNFAIFWGRALLKISGFRVKITGQENIPKQPVLIAANHTSFFDILMTLGYLPVNFNFVMKEELFKIPVFGRAVKTLGYFPISRKNARSAVRSMQGLVNFLRSGKNVLIFPEGTRNKTTEPLLPFKSGMAKIAQQAQVAILPVVIDCAAARQKVWQRGQTLTLTIGQTIAPLISDKREDLHQFTNLIREQMLEMFKLRHCILAA